VRGDRPLDALGVDEVALVDVDEHGRGAGLRDRLRRRDPARRRRDDLVAGAYAEHAQHDVDRVGAVAAGNAVPDAVSLRESPLELLDGLAADESVPFDDASECRIELPTVRAILRPEIDKRYAHDALKARAGAARDCPRRRRAW
jgi:hypothetical protein